MGTVPRPFFFLATSEALRQLSFQLRVFDESRTDLNWGTWIPVVDYDREIAGRFWFLRVPAAEPFRHTLRVYTTVRQDLFVRYYDADTDALLVELPVNVGTITTPEYFHEISSLQIPQLQGVGDVRIEVAGEELWAMVSITNNETQVVTILPGDHKR